VLTSKQLANLSIRRVIFHDIPKHIGDSVERPRFSEDITEIDLPRAMHLRKKLLWAFGASAAHPVIFQSQTSSQVPPEVRSITLREYSVEEFVAMSQRLGQYLFDMQHGTISPGLLAVTETTSEGRPGVILMKLEREEGARLEFVEHDGKKTFDMSVLDNLVLTEGTRLFKSAIFVRTGQGPEEFVSLACDSQLEEMAKFWLRFLGCIYVVEPRVATKRFYEAALMFINDSISDPVQKHDLYEHLHSRMKQARKTFSPRSFLAECVPSALQGSFRQHLSDHKMELNTFELDIADIKAKLRRRTYYTEKGATVSAPEEEAELIQVRQKSLLVNDVVVKVDTK